MTGSKEGMRLGPPFNTYSMLIELKKVFRLSSVYAAGDIFTMGIGLVLLPLYTAFLRPADYGILAVATVVTTISGIVLTFGLSGSALKFYYSLGGDEQKRFYGSLWLFLIFVPGTILLMVEVGGGRFFGALLIQVPYTPYVRIALWTAYVTTGFTILPKEMFRASERAFAYAGFNVGQFALATGFTIYLIVGLGQGVEGAMWARLVAVIGVGIIGTVVLLKSVVLQFDLRLLKRALLYSLPLLPHLLSHWVLAASDRIILERFVPLAEVGVYSVGYQIGAVMMLFAIAGNNGLIPLFGRLDAKSRGDVEKLVRIVTYYVLALTIIGLGITLFSSEIVDLLSPTAYYGAHVVVPWVVLGYLFMALYFPAMDTLNLVVGDTRKVSACTVGAAMVNVGLNLWLIPKYGAIAAAITTAIAYMLMAIGFFAFVRKTILVPYEFRRIGAILGGAFVTFLIGWNLEVAGVVPGILLKALSLTIFPVLLWVSGFFNRQERRVLQALFVRFKEAFLFC